MRVFMSNIFCYLFLGFAFQNPQLTSAAKARKLDGDFSQGMILAHSPIAISGHSVTIVRQNLSFSGFKLILTLVKFPNMKKWRCCTFSLRRPRSVWFGVIFKSLNIKKRVSTGNVPERREDKLEINLLAEWEEDWK